MRSADAWFMSRIGYVETTRAVGLAAGAAATAPFRAEWPAFGVVEIDQVLVERASTLAIRHGLRSIDSIHLAAALTLPVHDLQFATWDRRLHLAVRAEGLDLFPLSLP